MKKFFKTKIDKSQWLLVLLLVVVISFAVQVIIKGNNKPTVFVGESIRLSAPPLDASTLLFVAEEKGFFEKAQLQAEITDTDFGISAFDKLKNNEVDVVTVSDAAIAAAILRGDDFVVFAGLHNAKGNVQLIGRRSHGIESLYDLRGKKIGVIRNDVGDYFLYDILQFIDIPVQDVILQYGSRDELEIDFMSGELDAVVLRRRYVYELSKQLADDAFVTSGKDNYSATYNLVTSKQWFENNKDGIHRMLSVLMDASEYVRDNKKETVTLISNRLGVDKAFFDSVWEVSEYEIFLDYTAIGLVKAEIEYFASSNTTPYPENLVEKYFDYSILEKLNSEQKL